ncbi:endonuclease VII domain-containing protein [Streptomyces cyaneofuscatus]|uniref:endonuclease VII domain-containing protein n=1 Tax=Streptomyces cyaneofuscatus TaxID=66883 RepID=UPI0038684CCC|nr:endonuclease VII domain-containing protein [Streptomyces cyaneofuscatus]
MTTPTDQAAIEELKQRDYTCSTCREVKPGTEFRWSLYKRDSYCKVCRRARDRERYKNSNGAGKDKVFHHSLLRLYGITLDQYNEMLAKQGQLCALCGERPDTDRRMHVDHDHTTGKIRALLCHHCNLLLGNAKDSPARLRQAIAYLERHSSVTEA